MIELVIYLFYSELLLHADYPMINRAFR